MNQNMSTLLSTLGVGGNPFTTAVGQRIEQATDGSLASENWALNMEICDVINETDEGPKDAIRAIRKKLLQNAGKNYTIVMYTLTVLETCVKNCGRRFQVLVSQKDFVQDLVKLIGPKNDPPTAVQEKVLSLIQSWAEAFKKIPEMQGVVQVYQDLKQKGIEFPSNDTETMAPIITPSRSVLVPALQTAPVTVGPVQPQETSSAIRPQQMEKLKHELDIVRGNMHVFGEMLTELIPGKEEDTDHELLQELYKTCHSMQTRIVELLDRVGNEKITEDLLIVNDELNNLFMRYDRFEKKRIAMRKGGNIQDQVKFPVESKPLIDLDTSIGAVGDQLHDLDLNASAKNATEASTDAVVDEFDMLAQSRTQQTSLGAVGGISVTDSAQNLEFQREQDVDEVARWLDDKPEHLQDGPGPNTEEFDRFLASRAAAAERLPTMNQNIASADKDISLLKS